MPGQQLSHYRLLEKIGEGGMGVVWRAEDTVLGRSVAIKVLAHEVALDEQRRRMFLEEARLASTVSDARIVHVYELGREGDLDFIVMEFVEGKSLNRILLGRPLPTDKVAAIGEQVSRALSRAHRKGLLHRDLKPANIMVTPDGDIKVVDFGLATLLSAARSSVAIEPATLTAPSHAQDPAARAGSPRHSELVGTVPYMSPEQVRGETLDQRSDIFSLGTVLYEMTTGQRPFTGRTNTEVLEEILKTRPVAVHDLVPKVPLDLDRIIQKTLASHPGERYQTMGDLAVDLKRLGRELDAGSSPSYEEMHVPLGPIRTGAWRKPAVRVAAGIGIAAALTLAGWFVATKLRSGGPAPGHSVLVMPLEVRGQAEGTDYVGRAFAEALAVNLAGASDLRVLPVPSAPAARSDPMELSKLAGKSGADRVLSGSLTRTSATVTVSLNLLDAGENRLVWGEQLEMPQDQMTALASTLAMEAARHLGAKIRTLHDLPQNAIRRSGSASSPLVTEALGAIQSHEIQAAVKATARLVEAFPADPDAHALHANALLEAWHKDQSRANESALERELASFSSVDPDHPVAEVARAFVQSGKGDVKGSILRFSRILARTDLAPDLRAHILTLRGWNRAIAGELEASFRDLEEALRLTPADARVYAVLAESLRASNRLEESLVRARQAVTLDPSDPDGLFNLTMTLGNLGRWDEAAAVAEKTWVLTPNQTTGAGYATALHEAGRKAEAREVALKAEGLLETSGGAYNIACYWARVGDRASALRHLRRAMTLGYQNAYISIDPDLVSLHGDPDFEAMIAELRKSGIGR